MGLQSALTMDKLVYCVCSMTMVLGFLRHKFLFSHTLFLHNHLSLPETHLAEFYHLASGRL